jgi:hypothetical protein
LKVANYDDLFVRSGPKDTGVIPYPGGPFWSPDIIPYGTQPVQRPKEVFADFGQDFGVNIRLREDNYIYARGLNNAPGAASGKVYLYYTDSSMILWPKMWAQHPIRTDQMKDFIDVSSPVSGQNWIGDTPFRWRPEAAPNGHFCVISRVETAAHPNPVPDVVKISDLAAFLCNNRGFAWRNVASVMGTPPELSVPVVYDQGVEGHYMYVILECSKLPIGSSIAFTCGTPGPEPLLTLQKTNVTTYPNFFAGVMSTVPAGFSSNITYSFWSNGLPVPAEASIGLKAVYLTPVGHPLHEAALPLESIRGTDGFDVGATVGPMRGVVMGQFSTCFKGR